MTYIIAGIVLFAFFMLSLGIGMIFKKRAVKMGCSASKELGHKCQCKGESQDPNEEHDCCNKHEK